jgi:hypothetical protein
MEILNQLCTNESICRMLGLLYIIPITFLIAITLGLSSVAYTKIKEKHFRL